MSGICFVCGKRMLQAVTGKAVEGAARRVGGNDVRMHKVCAETFDADEREKTTTRTSAHHDSEDYGQ